LLGAFVSAVGLALATCWLGGCDGGGLSTTPGGPGVDRSKYLDRLTTQLERPWSDGTYALAMPALARLSQLAASVPRPRQHVVVCAGVLASNSR
jgi:hypothetical protein